MANPSAVQLIAPGQARMGDIQEVQIGEVPAIAKIGSVVCPCVWCCSFFTVEPNTQTAIMHCGNLTSLQAEQGLHCTWPCGLTRQTISVKQLSMSLPDSKITDSNGSPVLASAIVNYRVVDAKKALFSVDDYKAYVLTNSTAVLKQVVSTHTYDQLKSHATEVNAAMAQAVQREVEFAGVLVTSMCLNELNYAPEIASAMLRKQQAGAMMEARELIVEGAVKIAHEAVSKLEDPYKMKLSEPDKVKIVTNLLTVLCSESEATPTLSM